jgi:hypothetical protein
MNGFKLVRTVIVPTGSEFGLVASAGCIGPKWIAPRGNCLLIATTDTML